MEEQRVYVALGEQFEEAAPVVPKMHHEREMLAAGLRRNARIALIIEPFVAHRDVLPSNVAARGRHRRAQVFDFGAALERHEGAKLQLADGTLGWDFGEMRRAKYLAGTHTALIGDWMPAKIAKILRSETAEQLEVDDDARLLSRVISFVFLRQRFNESLGSSLTGRAAPTKGRTPCPTSALASCIAVS